MTEDLAPEPDPALNFPHAVPGLFSSQIKIMEEAVFCFGDMAADQVSGKFVFLRQDLRECVDYGLSSYEHVPQKFPLTIMSQHSLIPTNRMLWNCAQRRGHT
ncbi:MAG: hypothetical protein CMM47_11015 [Rhodospirillaceae bacterium]|nr:hypothetical protein [Rhodospirillaceae bacterium]